MKERINITLDKELLDDLRYFSKNSNKSISGLFNSLAYLIVHTDILDKISVATSNDTGKFQE